jgi:uncharacterized membrane protein YciS (DUF1049 family)
MSTLDLAIFYIAMFLAGTIIFVVAIGYMDKRKEKEWAKQQIRLNSQKLHPSTKIGDNNA